MTFVESAVARTRAMVMAVAVAASITTSPAMAVTATDARAAARQSLSPDFRAASDAGLPSPSAIVIGAGADLGPGPDPIVPDMSISGLAGGNLVIGGDGTLTTTADAAPFQSVVVTLVTLAPPINVQLAPVPEPAIWLIMVTGFGAVGVALRRRRRLGGASAAV